MTTPNARPEAVLKLIGFNKEQAAGRFAGGVKR
jgi:hypothetical protein